MTLFMVIATVTLAALLAPPIIGGIQNRREDREDSE